MAGVLGIKVVNGGGQLSAGSTQWITAYFINLQGVYVTDMPLQTTSEPVSTGSVMITLITPSDQVVVDAAPMTLDPTYAGFWNFTYQSQTTDERGPWRVQFNADDGLGNVYVSPTRLLFNMRG